LGVVNPDGTVEKTSADKSGRLKIVASLLVTASQGPAGIPVVWAVTTVVGSTGLCPATLVGVGLVLGVRRLQPSRVAIRTSATSGADKRLMFEFTVTPPFKIATATQSCLKVVLGNLAMYPVLSLL